MSDEASRRARGADAAADHREHGRATRRAWTGANLDQRDRGARRRAPLDRVSPLSERGRPLRRLLVALAGGEPTARPTCLGRDRGSRGANGERASRPVRVLRTYPWHVLESAAGRAFRPGCAAAAAGLLSLPEHDRGHPDGGPWAARARGAPNARSNNPCLGVHDMAFTRRPAGTRRRGRRRPHVHAHRKRGPGALDAGWAALRNGEWEVARAAFEESLSEGETPEALEGLGWAGHMLNTDRLTFDARERAYRLYLESGDKGSAGRIAAYLAADHLLFRGEPAVANGWLQRAHSLIDDLAPGIDHGWLAIHEGHIAVALDEDTAKARRLATRAIELGRAFGAPELEMLGLGLEGRALVSDGELDEGMRRLDEATTVALAGEARLLYCVAWACCYLISACERVRDFDRAAQWCARVGDFCGRHDIFLLNTCRAHYASVLSWQGRWEEAETQLTAAVGGLQASRPPMVGDAIARLGELRRRQGRLAEAEELFARSETHSLTLLGSAALALDRGQLAEAAELSDRYLRRFPEPSRVERGAGLELAIV